VGLTPVESSRSRGLDVLWHDECLRGGEIDLASTRRWFRWETTR